MTVTWEPFPPAQSSGARSRALRERGGHALTPHVPDAATSSRSAGAGRRGYAAALATLSDKSEIMT